MIETIRACAGINVKTIIARCTGGCISASIAVIYGAFRAYAVSINVITIFTGVTGDSAVFPTSFTGGTGVSSFANFAVCEASRAYVSGRGINEITIFTGVTGGGVSAFLAEIDTTQRAFFGKGGEVA